MNISKLKGRLGNKDLFQKEKKEVNRWSPERSLEVARRFSVARTLPEDFRSPERRQNVARNIPQTVSSVTTKCRNGAIELGYDSWPWTSICCMLLNSSDGQRVQQSGQDWFMFDQCYLCIALDKLSLYSTTFPSVLFLSFLGPKIMTPQFSSLDLRFYEHQQNNQPL